MILENQLVGQSIGKSIESTKSSNCNHYKLSQDEKRLVNELRQRVKGEISNRYDTDFNLYRWIRQVERTHSKPRNVLDSAEKLLRNHLRFRKAFDLDSDGIPTWDENPMLQKRVVPRAILHYLPSSNQFLWWVDFSDIQLEGIMSSFSGRTVLLWHFWQYEHALRVINQKERETDALSGICMILDVKNLNLTPGFMLAANNGHMSYIAETIFYEQYPQLANPVSIINVSKILMIPYRIVSFFMPHDFTDKFRVHDSKYTHALLRLMTDEELPRQLGGANPRSDSLAPIGPAGFDPTRYHQGFDETSIPQEAVHVQVPARKRKFLSACCRVGDILSWWMRADADMHFGIYFAPPGAELDPNIHEKVDPLEKLEMIMPRLLLMTKCVAETGSYQSKEKGTYYVVLCNKRSWFYRRNVQMKIEINGEVISDFQEVQL